MDEVVNPTNYKTNPNTFHMESQNPCTESNSPSKLNCTSDLQGETTDQEEPEPRMESPQKTAQEPSPVKGGGHEELPSSSENSEICM
jgi:hypothetical protein